MLIKPLITSKKNTKNKGFIALTIAVWAVIVLTTIIALEGQWLFVYIDQQFYKSEMIRLENMANRCLEMGYTMSISGPPEEFVWHSENMTCFGKTGDKIEATTTNGRFWYKKSKNFI